MGTVVHPNTFYRHRVHGHGLMRLRLGWHSARAHLPVLRPGGTALRLGTPPRPPSRGVLHCPVMAGTAETQG